MSREAVLLQWERKIEAAERRDGVQADTEATAVELAEPVPLRPAEDATRPGSRRFERTGGPARPQPRRFERRETAGAPGPQVATAEPEAPPEELSQTITIAGQAGAPRRRRPVVEAQLAQPDRIALWAFLLGLFLVAVAAGTAHA